MSNSLKIIAFTFVLLPSSWKAECQKKDASLYFQKGEDALDAQSYKTALAHFNECLRLDPYYMEAYYYRAQARESLGDAKGALTDFSIYLESKPHNTEALFARAQLRYQSRQWAMAREDFLKLLTTPPGETKSVFFAVDKESGNPIVTTQSNMTSAILNYLGLVDTKMKNYKRAIQYLDSAIKLDPKDPEFYINRGWARQEMLDTIQATSNYQKALTLNPESSLARHNLAVLSAKKGNLKEVEKLLSEAIERSPEDPHYYVARAINFTAQGDLPKALADYNSAIQLDNTDPDLWLRRGLIKAQLKDLTGALADYTRSIKLQDDNEKVWLQRGNLMMQMNRAKDAIEDYTIAITHHPEFGPAFYQRALARHMTGNLKEACDDLTQAQGLKVKVEEKLKAAVCK
jgi:tetratricopeptide (TPR) repeat protein